MDADKNMVITEYSWLTNDEVLVVVNQKKRPTKLELELAARLELALIFISELQEEVSDCRDQLVASDVFFHAGRQGKS